MTEGSGALTRVAAGKVRDIYAIDDEHLLLVASDRISAYDWVLPTPIPDKGRILTALSAWWFDQLADLVPHHLVSLDDPRIPAEAAGRAMLVRRLQMVSVECVARGFLTGSGLLDYDRTGEVCGIALPAGLVDGSRLPEPIFTPTSKAPLGEHDTAMTYDAVVASVGGPAAAELRERTLAIYARGEQVARDRGIVLADTKLEFGRDPAGRLVLADEVLTPDSSRFWPAQTWQPGRAQPSYDKQYVRDWLVSPASGWDRGSGQPPPPLPDDVVAATRGRYVEAYEQLTGRTWS
ncbi:MAG TPA: phosphoribosylaminoimidazolesuccinocarboxamide synthase [Mycobacteriales bacterium]